MKKRLTRLSSMIALVSLLQACGEETDPDAHAITLALPQQLQCANMPSDLSAQVWQSGTEEPTELTVDPVALTTSGDVEVRSGTRRNLVIDWYVTREGIRVVLAQVRASIDLTNPAEDTLDFTYTEEDISVTTCLDVSRDLQREGLPIRVNNVEVPMCDLDDSCGGTPNGPCSNLGEVCAGSDPLRLD